MLFEKNHPYTCLVRNNFNFLSSLFSRRDWFVGNPEDRFSRVVACVACSTALGQIFQVQQINILKTNIMRRLFIRYIETDLAWSSSLEDVRIMVRHEACPQEEIYAYMRCCQQCSQCGAVNQAWVYHTLGDLCPRTWK